MKGAKYPYRMSFDLPEKLYRKLHIARLDCDKRKKEIIIEAILNMNEERGTTFMLISHEMPTIRKMCKTINVMNMGSMIAQGPLEEVADNQEVIEAYLGGTDVFADD